MTTSIRRASLAGVTALALSILTSPAIAGDLELVEAGTVRCDLVFAGSDNGNTVPAHQPPHTTVTNVQAKLFQFFGHSRATITLQAQAVLLPNMGQQNHVFTLTRAGRPITPGPVTT
jgi:hypothetical protein